VRRVRSFPPLEDRHARVLILGSMPGAASLRAQQYYAHPQNRFWPIMGALCGATPDLPYAERVRVLERSHIAVWDVLHSCQRNGSLDAAIDLASAQPNELARLLHAQPGIRRVLCNGALSARLWRRHFAALAAREFPELECLALPSTSPANATWSPARKLAAWRAACGR
jgi:hypoxanthine-DNA glycosylase